MIEIMVGLGIALGLALVAVVYLAAVLPGRVVRLVLAEYARSDTRALVARAALHTASSTEVALIVEPLRALLDEQTQRTRAAREHTTAAAGEVERITHGLRGLVEWLAAFAAAQHAQAIAAQAIAAQAIAAQASTAQASAAAQIAPETTRRPDRAPTSRPRPTPYAPAIMPPGSATRMPPEPAQLAAGLTRPSARPLSATRTPSAEARPRSTTMIGLAASSGPRRAQPSSPTLLSMQAVAPPTSRPVPPVAMESEAGEPHEGGAA